MALPRRKKGRRLGLALASGGMLGGVYEVGALRALEEAIAGLDLNRLDVYVGVSAGAFVGAHIVNGITVTDMVRGLRAGPGEEHLFDPAIFFVPAFRELRKRGLQAPLTCLETLSQVLTGADGSGFAEGIEGLAGLLPLCLFDNEAIRDYLHRLFSRPGRTDDFRRLQRRFFVISTNLDTGGPVIFGRKGLDQVPISHAVQASTAVPGLYQPVDIEGLTCVDGVLLKTMHATVALGEGADLLFCVNPLVPWNNDSEDPVESAGRRAILRSGLPSLMSQCFRILIHSRVAMGVERAAQSYPEADLVLFEPESSEHRLFTNLFRFHSRHEVCEIGYRQTRKSLWARRKALGPVLGKHGLALRADVLADPGRRVWDCLGAIPGEGPSVAERLESTLRQLETLLG
jgi:predicted acylesterase/phospholipase RssA